MKHHRLNYVALIGCFVVTVVLSVACGGGSSSGGGSNDQPVVKGDRTLGLHVNSAEDDNYNAAVTLAKSAGVAVVHLSLDWDDIETAPNVYGNPYLGISDSYYPASGLTLQLTLRPINSSSKEVPSDLAGVAFDNSVMIERFKQLLTYVFAQIPNLTLHNLVIGNEIEPSMAVSADWQQYGTFFQAVSSHAKTLRPDLRIGVTGTFSGLIESARSEFQTLNQSTDFVSATYYPLQSDFSVKSPSVVDADFAALVALYPGRDIVFQECGYPSGAGTSSSEALQAEFVTSVFTAWDAHATDISHISFLALHDWPADKVDTYLDFYGVSDPAFASFLGSLGMRTFAGSGADKTVWSTFTAQAAARGWQ